MFLLLLIGIFIQESKCCSNLQISQLYSKISFRVKVPVEGRLVVCSRRGTSDTKESERRIRGIQKNEN